MKRQGEVINERVLGEHFIASHGKSAPMGQPMKGMFLIGFDSLAEKYQLVSMSTMGTAVHTPEGFPTRDGSAIVFYGRMDEPMLDVHGRTVKYVFRREGAEQYSIDVSDLRIGDEGSLVMRTLCTLRES